MRLEVLLSAMHLDSYRYIDTLSITSDCIVINQCDRDDRETILDNGRQIKFISSSERGLSRSRNMALDHATADICILCDNDVEYVPDYKEKILGTFEQYTAYDIIVFFVRRNGRDSGPYCRRVRRMGYLSALKPFSPEIAFRRKSLEGKGIRFRTQFGAGSRYSMGEEHIFLYECLREGLKILYVPTQIAQCREEKSTWFHGFTEKYFIDRGAVFYEMSSKFSTFLIWQFALRKYWLYKNERTLSRAIKLMLEGRERYCEELKVEARES